MIRYKEHEKLSLCEQLNRGQQTHLAAQMKHEALWHRRGEEAPNCIFKHLSKLSSFFLKKKRKFCVTHCQQLWQLCKNVFMSWPIPDVCSMSRGSGTLGKGGRFPAAGSGVRSGHWTPGDILRSGWPWLQWAGKISSRSAIRTGDHCLRWCPWGNHGSWRRG